MRFAVFAERAVGVIDEARQIEALPSQTPNMAAHDVFSRVQAKSAAAKDIETFTALLYPEDESVN